MSDESPTSAQLRAVQDAYARTQAALAASQADLTRVERERDAALAAQQRLSDRLTEGAVRLAMYRRGRAEATERALELAAELASARQEIGHQRGLLDEVIAENSRMRHRIAVAGEHRVDVARTDLTAPCGDCGGPILRGHAVERIPTTDLWRHCACPDKKAETDG